jgi:uncharacterized LabA/DUF88 family protein
MTTTTNICVLIDFENIERGSRQIGYGRFDVGVVMDALRRRGNVRVARAYADFTRYPEHARDLLRDGVASMQLSSSERGKLKNGADIALAVDAITLAQTCPFLDTFVVLSADVDFVPLLFRLREMGKTVWFCSVEEITSTLLLSCSDEFIAYGVLFRAAGKKRVPPDDSSDPEGMDRRRRRHEEDDRGDGPRFRSRLREDRSRDGRDDRPRDDRPRDGRDDRFREDRPREDRPREDGDRPREDRPFREDVQPERPARDPRMALDEHLRPILLPPLEAEPAVEGPPREDGDRPRRRRRRRGGSRRDENESENNGDWPEMPQGGDAPAAETAAEILERLDQPADTLPLEPPVLSTLPKADSPAVEWDYSEAAGIARVVAAVTFLDPRDGHPVKFHQAWEWAQQQEPSLVQVGYASFTAWAHQAVAQGLLQQVRDKKLGSGLRRNDWEILGSIHDAPPSRRESHRPSRSPAPESVNVAAQQSESPAEVPPSPEQHAAASAQSEAPASSPNTFGPNEVALVMGELENLYSRRQKPMHASELSQALCRRIAKWKPKLWGFRTFGAMLMELEKLGRVEVSTHPESQDTLVAPRS